jgi:hypothetical protein
MDKELQDYFENYFSLFQHDGWKQLIEELEDTAASIDLLSLEDAKELHLVQGKLSMLNQILNWKDSVTNAYESNEEDQSYQSTNLQ